MIINFTNSWWHIVDNSTDTSTYLKCKSMIKQTILSKFECLSETFLYAHDTCVSATALTLDTENTVFLAVRANK